MSYIKAGYNEFLLREEDNPFTALTQTQADSMLPEIPGENVTDNQGETFYFLPTKQPANPREGDAYFDETEKKLKVFNGSTFEIITSS